MPTYELAVNPYKNRQSHAAAEAHQIAEIAGQADADSLHKLAALWNDILGDNILTVTESRPAR